MSAQMGTRALVLNEPQAMRFEINRAALVDPSIFAAERERVFERCWLYVGHESEVRAPGDFRTRLVCGRPILLCRDSANELRVFLNTCRHRGTVVCREAEGNAERYTCFYHGWTYDRDGRLYAVPGQSAYPPNFDRSQLGLKAPPRVEVYRGFVFLNFDANAAALKAYLGAATENIDLALDEARAERVRRLGECRAKRVADANRGLVVFPHWGFLAGSSVSVRCFQPTAPARVRVRAWALGPVEESPLARQVRLDSFLTFSGPGGF